MKSKTKWMITILVIVILALTLVSILFVNPKINDYISNKQIEGYDFALFQIINTTNSQGYAQIQNGDKIIVCQNVEVTT